MRSKLRKTIMNLLLVLCMAVSMFSINVFAEDSNSTDVVADSTEKIDGCETVIKEYSEKEAKSYLAGDNTYPTLDGYRFAGWYTDKVCSKNTILGSKTPTGTTYALFVPEHVLSIKAQVSVNLINDNKDDDTKASLRFITSVDSLLYKEVGFEVTYEGTDGKTRKATSASNKVYSSLYVCGNDEVWEKKPADVFCNLSKYFKICTLKEFTMTIYDETAFTVTPYWITADGAKVYGVSATKTFVDGTLRDEAWVSTNGSNTYNHGSEANPYQTLDFALTHIQNGGKVHLVDTVSLRGETDANGETGWPAHGKTNVTITDGMLDVTTDDLCINDGVIFSNMTLKIAATDVRDFNRIFAEGNHVKIASDVTVSNQEATVQIFGGGMNNDVENTNLEVCSGTYALICGGSSGKSVTNNTNVLVSGNVSATRIYGGGYSGHVYGDTNVTIGSGVNPDGDYNNDDYIYSLYGGGHSGNVYGDVNIDVKEGATFNYVHGGVGGDPGQENVVVEGSIDITFAGHAHGLYGGSLNGTNSHTKIRMTGGKVHQIFGGTRKETMEGNTDVRIEGGIVHRRIYGGSYNDYNGSWDNPSRQVKGYAGVTISTATGVNLDSSEMDRGIVALSRYKEAQPDEWGVLIFEDNLYDTYSSKIGSTHSSTLSMTQYYHYLVKASTNGDVHSAGDFLSIEPDSGYVATVYQIIDGVEVEKHYTESDSYYKLPQLESSTDKTEILVKFAEKDEKDFTGYEAKIDGAYYKTLEEAIVAVDKYKNAEIEDLGVEKRLVKVSVEDSTYGTITADKEYCFVGDTIIIKENKLLNTAYYLAGLKINEDEVGLNLDGTYNLKPTIGGEYVVTGVYKKAIFEPRSPWSLVNQNQNVNEKGVTSGTITLPSGGYGMLYLYRSTTETGTSAYDYGTVDYTLTLKDWGGTDSVTPYTMFEFIFDTDSGEKVYQLRVEEKDGAVQIRNNSNSLVSGEEVHYTFSDTEYALYTGNGVNVRVLREGIKVSFYVNDEFKTSIYLPSPLDNDDMARVRLQRDGDSEVQVDIPFKVSFPEKEIMAGKYVSIIGDGISMSTGIPTNADGTSTAGNNSTTATNNETGIYGNTIDQGIGSDWTKLYWGQSLTMNGMHLLVNNSISEGTTVSSGEARGSQLHADAGTLSGETPDIIYLYVGTEDRKQTNCSNFETSYRSTLSAITTAYPEAEVFCFTTMAFYNKDYGLMSSTSGTSSAQQRMPLVNNAIIKVAGEFENVTLVDIKDLITTDNYETYFPVAETMITPHVDAHTEIAALLQRALESQFDKGVSITVKTSEYGTITTDKLGCRLGDTVVITAPATDEVATGYYLAGVTVNGEEVVLDSDGTYSITAEEDAYVIEGIYRKKIFTDNTAWDLSQQNQGTDENGVTTGIVTLPSGGYGALWLYRSTTTSYDYGDIDLALTLKDNADGSGTPVTQVDFILKTESTEEVLQLYVEEVDGVVQVGNKEHTSYLIGSNVFFELDDEEAANYKADGIEFRVLREGTKISLFVDGEFKTSIYLNYLVESDTNLPAAIENDTMARVRIQRAGDEGVQVAIPYKLSFPEKESMEGKYVSILGDGISMSAGVPTNADGTSTADNNSTTSVNNATDIYGNTIDQGIGTDWTKLYWGQSLVTNGMNLLVNNSVSQGLLHANPHTNTYGGDTSKLQYYLPGYQRAGELDADQGTLAGTTPDIIYLYMGTEDRKQSDPTGFESKYEETLNAITSAYPEAEIFCFTTMGYYDGGGYRGVGYSSGNSAGRMKTVNDAITKLACQYENVTLVDIADIITIDNYTTYFPEGVTRVAPRVEAHDIIATRLQKALESQFSKE